MSRYIFLFMFFIILLITGCSPAAREPLKTAVPPLKNEWTIKLNHSGGIIGLSRSIEISSNGKYTVTDGREDKTITKQLSANALSELHEIVSNSEFVSPEKSLPSGCADCFIYNLEIQQGNGKPFSVQVDDITMPGSGMEKLIAHLRGLIDAVLK